MLSTVLAFVSDFDDSANRASHAAALEEGRITAQDSHIVLGVVDPPDWYPQALRNKLKSSAQAFSSIATVEQAHGIDDLARLFSNISFDIMATTNAL